MRNLNQQKVEHDQVIHDKTSGSGVYIGTLHVEYIELNEILETLIQQENQRDDKRP